MVHPLYFAERSLNDYQEILSDQKYIDSSLAFMFYGIPYAGFYIVSPLMLKILLSGWIKWLKTVGSSIGWKIRSTSLVITIGIVSIIGVGIAYGYNGWNLSAGILTVCGIKTDGTLACWGDGGFGQLGYPAGISKQVSIGSYIWCSIQSNNSVICWGWKQRPQDISQTIVHAGNFTQVSAAGSSACAIKTDNFPECWSFPQNLLIASPAIQLKSISTGDSHACWVKIDNTLQCWVTTTIPRPISALAGSFKSVSVWVTQTCTIRSDGVTICWLPTATWTLGAAPPPVAFKSISLWERHACGVTVDDTIRCWGNNLFGESTPPTGFFKAVTAGAIATCWIKLDNSVQCWGNAAGGWVAPLGLILKALEDTPITPPPVPTVQVSQLPNILLNTYCPSCNPTAEVFKDSINTTLQTTKATIVDSLDPVNLSTGEFDYHDTFLTFPKNNPTAPSLEFKVQYLSQVSYTGSLAPGWIDSYDRLITESASGAVVYSDGNFGVHSFTPSTATGSCQTIGATCTIGSINATLTRQESPTVPYSVRFTNGNQLEFGANGRVVRESDANGNTLDFTYTASGTLLDRVTNTRGEFLSYTWNTDKRITQVTDSIGRKVEMIYAATSSMIGLPGDLIGIRLIYGSGALETKSLGFEYGIGSALTGALQHNITALIDAKGQTYVRNSYDANDRVTRQFYGDGEGSFAYTTASDPKYGTYVASNTAINKAGVTTLYTMNPQGSILSQSRQTASGSITTRYEFDSMSGLVSAEIAPSGKRTEYTYDILGNPTSIKTLSGSIAQEKTLVYDAARRPTKICSEISVCSERTYSSSGMLITESQTAGTATPRITSYTYDSSGRPTQILTQDGRLITLGYATNSASPTSKTETAGGLTRTTGYTYDSQNRLTSLTNPSGKTSYFTYDVWGKRIRTTGEAVPDQDFIYDLGGNLTQMSIAQGTRTMSSTYDILDRVTSSVQSGGALSRTTTRTYTPNNELASEYTSDSPTVSRTYNVFDRVTTQTLAGTGATSITRSIGYDADGNIVSTIDPLGRVTLYRYDEIGRPTQKQSPDGVVETTLYNSKSLPIEVTTATGTTGLARITLKYNDFGEVIERVTFDPNNALPNRIETTTRDSVGRATQTTNARGESTQYAYDSFGRLTTTTRPDGTLLRNIYDAEDRVTLMRTFSNSGVLLSEQTMSYDAAGRVIAKTVGSGIAQETMNYSYNSLGELARMTDPKGAITEYTYDGLGNQISSRETSSGSVRETRTTYDRAGRVTSLRDALGQTTNYSYDSFGRIISEQYPDGKQQSFAYNSNGQITEKTLQDGIKIVYSYDILGQKTGETVYAPGAQNPTTERQFSYDALGRLTSASETGWISLGFTYNGLGDLTTTTKTASGVTSTITLSVDQLGAITSIRTPNNHEIIYERNTNSHATNIALKRSPTSESENLFQRVYDGERMMSESLTNGHAVNYVYDPLGRLTSLTRTTPTSLSTVLWATKNGDLWSATDLLPSRNFTYDTASNLLWNGEDSYAYSPFDEITATSYTREGKNSTTEIETGENFVYDPLGNMVGRQRYNETTRTVNVCTTTGTGKNKVKTCTPTPKVTRSLGAPKTSAFTDTNALLSTFTPEKTGSGYTEIEAYNLPNISDESLMGDGTGTGGTEGSGSISDTPPQSLSGSTINYTYDDRGNMLSDGRFLYTYNDRNLLTSVILAKNNRVIESYQYDPLGRKSSRISGSLRTEYFSLGDTLIEEVTTATSPKKIRGVIQPYEVLTKTSIASLDPGVTDDVTATLETRTMSGTTTGATTGGGTSAGYSTLLFHHHDQLGSTIALTSSTGSLVEAYRYSAWGVPEVWTETKSTILSTGTSSGNTNSWSTNSGTLYTISKWSALNKPPRTELLYTGRPYSYKTKLSDLRARVYSPYQSRFLQRDPIGYGDGMNVYLYTNNSPLMYVDRDGMKAKQAIGEVAIIAADVTDLAVVGEWVGAVAGYWYASAVGDEYLKAATSEWLRNIDLMRLTDPLNPMKKVNMVGKYGTEVVKKSRYIPPKTKDTVRVRDGNVCVYCKKPTNTEKISNPEKSEIDHKDAFTNSKDNSTDNLQNTCRTCNRAKGTKSDSLFRSLFDF